MKHISKESTDVTEIVVVELNGAKYRRISYKTASVPPTWQRHILTFHGYKWEPLFASGWDLESAWRQANGLDAAPPPPAAKTVKVRIAVAVSDTGDWCAGGCATESDKASATYAEHNLMDGDERRIYWLTAELPIPSPAEIPAAVQAS